MNLKRKCPWATASQPIQCRVVITMEIRLRTALAWRTVDPLQQHCSRNVGALQHLNAVDLGLCRGPRPNQWQQEPPKAATCPGVINGGVEWTGIEGSCALGPLRREIPHWFRSKGYRLSRLLCSELPLMLLWPCTYVVVVQVADCMPKDWEPSPPSDWIR